MNYILIRSIAVRVQGHEGVNLLGPTYIEYYANSDTATVLDGELQYMLWAKRPIPTKCSQGFYYKYTTEEVPLAAVLEFFEKRGYRLVRKDLIENTLICFLEKTDQSTQTKEQSKQTTEPSAP